MALTLEEIAKLAGVSRSTVSRVINNQPNVRQEVRERVQQVILEVDYLPNRAARSLAGNPTQVIGLVIPQAIRAVFSDPYFPTLIEGIVQACNEQGYAMILGLITPELQDPYRRLVRDGFLDGVIVASAVEDDPFVERLCQDDFPFTLVGRLSQPDCINYVDVDNMGGARMAVQHLARLGYSRIATITGPMDMVAGQDRHSGYVDGLRRAGLPVDPTLVVHGDFSEVAGYRGMQQLLSLAEPPDAVFAATDIIAIGAMQALADAGLQVPQDVALVGFDDIPLAALVSPPLTTVRQPIAHLGHAAATMLIDMLEEKGESTLQRVVLPTELVVRSSSGHGASRPALHRRTAIDRERSRVSL